MIEYATEQGDRLEAHPAAIYPAALEQVRAMLKSEVGIRRDQRWILDRFEALPDGALMTAELSYSDAQALGDEVCTQRATVLGLLRKYIHHELARSLGVASVNLRILRDAEWRD